VDYPCGEAAAIGADLYIPGDGVISRGYHCGRQRRLDLLHQGPQIGLHTRILVQQVRKTALPPLRLRGAGLF
jgi:hypothetical protein